MDYWPGKHGRCKIRYLRLTGNNQPSAHSEDAITAAKRHVPLPRILRWPLSDGRGLCLLPRNKESHSALLKQPDFSSLHLSRVRNYCTETEVCAFMLQQPCVQKWHLCQKTPFGEAWYAICCQDITKNTVALFKKQGTAQGINS